MQLSEAVNKIKERNYAFEIAVEGKKPFGKRRIDEAVMHAGSLEDYFKRVAKHNGVTSLAVSTFQPNGSSFIRKDFFSVEIPAVVEPTKTVDTPTNFVDEQQQKPTTKTTNMNDANIAIEAATLKIENKFLTKENTELAARIKKLEATEEKLQIENRDLLREHAIIKDRHELELKSKMHEVATQSKSGLDGVVDFLDKNPGALEFVAGFFPNHAMNKALTEETKEPVDGVDKHEDEDAQVCIDSMIMPALLKMKSEEVGMIAVIIENLAKDPKYTHNLYAHLTKPEQTDKKD